MNKNKFLSILPLFNAGAVVNEVETVFFENTSRRDFCSFKF